MRAILCLLLSIVAAFSDAQAVISLNDSVYSQATMPKRDVKEIEDGIIVTYYFDNAIVLQDLLYPECQMWKIPGFGLNETVEEPAIPSRWDSFTLPQNTTIKVEIIDSSYVDFAMQLSPARPILVDSDTIEHTSSNVLPIASYNGFFPETLVKSSIGNAYRGVPLLDVCISPLQYDYKQQVVRAYKKITYKITFLASYRKNKTSAEVNINDDYLSIATINQTSKINRSAEAIQDNRDYLIITNSELRPVAEEFAEWKRTLGFRTSIESNDSWSIESVKNTVTQYYNNSLYNLYYLLILGDENIVPAIDAEYSSYDCITDLYYACMDGDNDFIADIYYGRIPVNESLGAIGVLNKIRAYEESPTTDNSFYNTGLNCAYFQDDDAPKNYADRRFAQTSEEVLQYMTNQGNTINRVYCTKSANTPLCWNKGSYGFGDSIPNYLRKPEFAWNGGFSDIINYINQGTFYVLHRDHGSPYSWGDPYLHKNHISSLSNQDKLPIVFSLNCKTGRFQESSTTDCFAETFLKKENGGCVAIYAATGSSFSGYNDALATGMFDAIWPSPGLRSIFPNSSNGSEVSPTPSPTYELGQILAVGMTRMQETWGAIRTTGAQYTRKLFHLFGDPSMQIYTACPANMQTPDICRVDNIIYVNMKDGDARISFYHPSTKHVDTFYGSNISYPTTSNDVVICVSRHNYIPYITNSNSLVYIQNEIIDTDKTFLGDTIKVGRGVTNKKTQGDVIVKNGIVSITGKKVLLDAGTKISKGGVLKIGNP